MIENSRCIGTLALAGYEWMFEKYVLMKSIGIGIDE